MEDASRRNLTPPARTGAIFSHWGRCFATALLASGCARVLGFDQGEPGLAAAGQTGSGGIAQGGKNDGGGPLTSGTNGADPAGAGGDAVDATAGQAGAAGAPPDLCGNGYVDEGEECDGGELGGATCGSLTYAGGRLSCQYCAYDTSECYVVRSLDVSSHVCAVLSNSKLKCWGANAAGQLGLGNVSNRGEEINELGEGLPLIDLGEKRQVLEVSTGFSHTCVILDGNEVVCWGANDFGQLGQPSDGNLLAPPSEAVDLGDDDVAQITAGRAHTCALFTNGRVKCWGENKYGQLGLGHTQPRGKLKGEMGNSLPFVDLGTDTVGDPLKVAAIDAGEDHTCALTAGYAVKCWGYNGAGSLGLGSFEETRGEVAQELGDNLPAVNLYGNAYVLSAGGYHNCVKAFSELKCWGSNSQGQLGYGDFAMRGVFPEQMGAALLPLDVGSDPLSAPASSLYAMGFSAGYSHTCAWFLSGGMKCWGSNESGELGLGDIHSRGNLPEHMGDHLPFVDLGADQTIISVHAGISVTCAILKPGRVKCWGWNRHGTLGAGHVDDVGVRPEQMGDALPFVKL
ncbi:MAG TPA: hypothetical protein VJN18_35350 [Polyangiaceae bacterium]|nr:hypothetical protein [Polyangiaceae bacterium]